MMSKEQQKELVEIKNVIVLHFTKSDWLDLGYSLGFYDIIETHTRLLRSLDFGDEDYEGNILQVLKKIITRDSKNLNEIKAYLVKKYAVPFEIETKTKKAGDIIKFIKEKEYVMLNDNLGSGSFGKTVLLQDLSIEELFVAKKYEPDFSSDNDKREFYKSFVQEIKIMHKLFHKNLVRIFNFYLYPDLFTGYILMEYIDGKSIDEYLAEEFFPWDFDIADKIFIQLLDAFNFLEQNGILHRDIREKNILVDKDGIVKIIDFGLGKIMQPIEKSNDSKDGIINRYNMAKFPNEFQNGKYTYQTDMFCIAELLERIISENNLKDFKYFNILEKMTKPNAKDRYKSFQEIIDLINKKQFELLKIAEVDKIIYQEFSSAVCVKLNYYSEVRKFENNIDKIIKKIEKVIEENSLETFIQFNEKLISVFVLSGYGYNSKENIPCEVVINFYKWFIGLSTEYQRLVIDNLILKLSKIKIKEEEDNLPF